MMPVRSGDSGGGRNEGRQVSKESGYEKSRLYTYLHPKCSSEASAQLPDVVHARSLSFEVVQILSLRKSRRPFQ
jgi:hypothetical protein